MSEQRPNTEPVDPRVGAAVAEYLQLLNRGEILPVEQFVARYPDIADDLRALLAGSGELVKPNRGGPAPADAQSGISTHSITERYVETIALKRAPVPRAGETMLLRLPESFGRYRIVRPLGSGAMGDVYLADDLLLHRQVAIKTPSFGADQTGELLERFYREARSAAVLRHSHICPVFDVGEINGCHYISMAYIDGLPLSSFIRPDKLQPERQTLAAIRKLAIALQEAHDHGIIHRDLKPGNVMIDRKGEPIVMDFGLARGMHSDVGAQLTQTGMLVGSPSYMSPEQVEGDTTKLTCATDQYSLGVILYELLTGTLPFRGGVTAVIGAILTKEPTPPGQIRSGVDPRVEALCLKMMAKSPGNRFPSMRAVADAIAAILKSDPDRSSDRSTRSGPAHSQPKSKQPSDAAARTIVEAGFLISPRSLEALVDAARNCMEKHDYEQVVRILDAIPEPGRNDQVRALLDKAREMSASLAFPVFDLGEANRVIDYEALDRHAQPLPQSRPQPFKALPIKRGPGGSQTSRVANPVGWPSTGRVRGDANGIRWLPLGIFGGLIGIGLLSLLIILNLPEGEAIVHFRIGNPDIEIGFRGQKYNAGNANEEIKFSPGEDELAVTIRGATYTSDKFILNEGENPPIVVELLDNLLSARFGDRRIGVWSVPSRPIDQDVAQGNADNGNAASRNSANGNTNNGNTANGGVDVTESTVANQPGGNNSDLAKMQGTWEAVSEEFNGTAISAEELRKQDKKLTVLNDQFNIDKRVYDGTRAKTAGTIEIVSGVTPRQFNWSGTWLDGTSVQLAGLYELKGDSLRIVYQMRKQGTKELRPRKFASSGDGSGTLVIAFQRTKAENDGWTDLFNGRDLTGWKGLSGRWRWENGELVGSTSPGGTSTNTVLCSDQQFGDFELEFEVKLDQSAANSGLQFRSRILDVDKFIVHGPQVDIGGQFWGSLYDEGNNAMIQRADNVTVQRILRPGSYNAFVVQCVGKHVTIKLNGAQVVDGDFPSLPDEGIIGWQLHSGDSMTARFRNVRLRKRTAAPSSVSTGDARENWTDLFNGRDLTGWKGLVGDPVKRSQMTASQLAAAQATADRRMREHWRVVDGVLEFDGQGDNLCTIRDYGDFELSLEWKISPGGDSGVYLRGCPQIQIWDPDSVKLYAEKGSGGLYNNNFDPRIPLVKADKPVGEWNTFLIRMIGDRVTVDLNGKRVVDNVVMENYFAPGKPIYTSGPIELQNHSGRLWFRNIRIRELSSGTPSRGMFAPGKGQLKSR